MANQIKKYWYMVLLKGVIMVLLAILMLASPRDALLTLATWLGLGLLIAGIAILIQGIALRNQASDWGWRVLEGCLDILIGSLLMANPVVTAEILPFLMGFWAAFYGIYLVIVGVSEAGNRGLKIISGILIILLANAIMYHPLFAGLTIAVWIGIALLFIGIYNVIYSFSLK